MKKHFLSRALAIGLIVLGFIVLGINSFSVIAQEQDITPPTTEETPEQPTGTSTSTPEPPILEVKKEYQLINDRNANGNIDPGDKIKYTIRVENKGSVDISNLVIIDKLPGINFFNIPEDISKGGTFNGEFIEWTLGQLAVGISESFNYSVTLKDTLDPGAIEILNPVTIFSGSTPLAEAISRFSVVVPTLTPTLSETPSTPTPTESLPGASVLWESMGITIIVGILAVIGIGVFTYLGGIAPLRSGENGKPNDEITMARVSIFREGVIIIFIVSAVLLMALAGTLPSDGAISILSATVGYVFGRASSR